jgi:hypothetical protein
LLANGDCLPNKLTETAIIPGPRAGDDYFMPAAEVIEEAGKLQGKKQDERLLPEELTAEAEGAWPEECDIEGTPPLALSRRMHRYYKAYRKLPAQHGW